MSTIKATTQMVFFLFALLAGNTWAQDVSIKAESVVGEVSLQKGGKADWVALKVGAKIKQSDKIRTAVESQASLLFENGSLVTVAENSLIEMKSLLASQGVTNTKFGVKSGKLLFNIKKLAVGNSSFEFETQTATAAIRGTEGDVQVNGSRSLASLETGRLEMISGLGKATIGPGQLVLQTNTGFVVLPKPKDASAYQKLADQYLRDTTVQLDSLIGKIQKKLDSIALTGGLVVVDTNVRAKKDTTAATSLCSINSYPSEVSDARLTVTGTAPDKAEISSGSIKTVSSGGAWSMDLAWNGMQLGQKTFIVTALQGATVIPCGVIKFNFVASKVPLDLKISTPNPFTVCKGPLVLAGVYTGSGARLVAKVGGSSLDISSPDGKFSAPVVISDQARNWDLDHIDLVLTNSENSITQSLALKIDRSCKDVNRIPPQVIASIQPNTCLAIVGVSNVQGDEVLLKVLADGSEIDETTITSDLRGRRVNLQEGKHDYLVRATDLAGNKQEQVFAKTSCWPDVRFDIAVDGQAKEVLRIPPPPPGQSATLQRNVNFSVKNLPSDNYGYLKRVTLKKNGRVLLDLRGIQIRDVSFSQAVELDRNKKNLVSIEVESQSGRIRTAEKEYDFR